MKKEVMFYEGQTFTLKGSLQSVLRCYDEIEVTEAYFDVPDDGDLIPMVTVRKLHPNGGFDAGVDPLRMKAALLARIIDRKE